jgi:hypothetical protein
VPILAITASPSQLRHQEKYVSEATGDPHTVLIALSGVAWKISIEGSGMVADVGR